MECIINHKIEYTKIRAQVKIQREVFTPAPSSSATPYVLLI